MDPIYTFGFKLAELTYQKEFAGIGLLCLAIKDSGKEYKNLSYEDFKNVFLNYLPRRLEKMTLANPQQVVVELMNILNKINPSSPCLCATPYPSAIPEP